MEFNFTIFTIIAVICTAVFAACAAVSGGQLKTPEERTKEDAEQIACINAWKKKHAKIS